MERIDNQCKNCGAKLDLHTAVGGVITCEYCGSIFTLPKGNSTPSTLTLLRNAEANLDTRRFDDAYTLYRKAAEESPNEPEAYFGMALATAQVQYLKDFRADGKTLAKSSDFRMQPICYEVSEKKFTEDKNYLKALKLATPEQQKAYREKAEEIDRIRNEFSELKKSGLTYDCFICVKVSSEDGKGHTEDALLATKLYHELKNAGYNPFFSEEEMKDRSGAKYEALILYALYCSDCMLVICTNENYLQSPWVKNEYTRYMKMLVEADKQRESITIAFSGTPIEKLPGLPGKIQGIDLGSFDGLSRVLKFVDKFSASNNAVPEIQRKDYGNITIQKKQSLKQEIEKRKIEIIKGGTISVSDSMNLNNAITFMQREDFQRATKYCMEVIKDNPTTSKAYWLLFLCENKCVDSDSFINLSATVENFDNFEKTIATTEDEEARKEYYNILYEHVKQQKDLSTYKEFVALPESTQSQIDELNEIMYATALADKDANIFNTIIKTVTDTDKYIEMNIGFAHVVSREKAIECYRNVLKVDEGNQEALYECFIDYKYLSSEANLFEYCANTRNRTEIENKLFGYGYNAYAVDKLIAVCLGGINKNTEAACNVFDFLLSMIPGKNNKMFKEYLNKYIDELFRNEKYDYITKYNNLLLSLDEFDDNAYFNRVKLTYKINNLYAFMKVADKLLDDENYMSAYNAYATKHAEEINLYMQLNDTFNDLVETLKYPECIDFVINSFETSSKEEILQCKTQILSAVADKSESYFKEFLSECKVKSTDELFKLLVNVTMSPKLKLTQNFAVIGNNNELLSQINEILTKQPECASQLSQAHNVYRRHKSILISSIICGITLIAFMSLMIGFPNTTIENNIYESYNLFRIVTIPISIVLTITVVACYVTLDGGFKKFLFNFVSYTLSGLILVHIILFFYFQVPQKFIIETYNEEMGIILYEYNGHSYHIFDGNISWTDAETQCESLGGHLATITSEDEQELVKYLRNKIGHNTTSPGWCWDCTLDRYHKFWIGSYYDKEYKLITPEYTDFPNKWISTKKDTGYMSICADTYNSPEELMWIYCGGSTDSHILGYICEWDYEL